MRRIALALAFLASLSGCASVPISGDGGSIALLPVAIPFAPFLLTGMFFDGIKDIGRGGDGYEIVHDNGRVETYKFRSRAPDFNSEYENAKVQTLGAENGSTIDGLRQGSFKAVWSGGAAASSGHYFDDKRHGEWREWWPNGRLKSCGNYDKDDKIGYWDYYYPNGQDERVELHVRGEMVYVLYWRYR